VVVEDDYAGEGPADFVTLVEANHGYPATNLQWQPASAVGYRWRDRDPGATELLATTGDVLRIWEYASDGPTTASAYVGRPSAGGGHRLSVRGALSGATKGSNNSITAPLTSFSWNEQDPSRIVTASIDTTCTIWDIDRQAAVTQLIAHDREVYDVAWLPQSTDIFVSVGADGSLRAFDLRSLEHSTILYETPAPKKAPAPAAGATSAAGGAASPGAGSRPTTSALLRICFHPTDSNYLATFHMDGSDVQILDMRSPGQPVMEMRAHRAQVNAVAFGSGEQPLLATAGDDCQLLLWDLAPHKTALGAAQTSGSGGAGAGGGGAGRLNSPRPDASKRRVVTEPAMAYTGPAEITSLAWSPPIVGGPFGGGSAGAGEWLAVAMGRTVKALKV
jgi:WD repeat-containing protein 68